ncbi:SusC/RagA family TonB-linked outer membrane protein [Chitinophaga sp. 30R24]|uniref:SusC/RagA family TonB-linked outer membrane protein n=1 Tax=Chitinophaga sp. 30R24 TaxID=3248838 RepID=UPI003B9193E6
MRKSQCLVIARSSRKWYLSLLFPLFFLLATVIFYPVSAQDKPVHGIITNETGQPLPGVNITLKGSGIGTTSNNMGAFSMRIADENSVLVFKCIGMKTQEVTVGRNASINIALEAEPQSLQEVVAIGYGVARKKDLTSSMTTIEGQEVARRNVTQVSQALQGTMPGVMVTRTNSAPGASASIRVRGITTIGNSEPLVIVDGVPINSIDDVKADDIQDISVLKDAASASIYGARAAAGVILITTKRPRSGKFSLEYSPTVGFEKMAKFPEVVGVKRYLEMINEFTWNDAGNAPGGEYALYAKDKVDNWLERNKTNPNDYPVTDWIGKLVNNSAFHHNHYLSLSAGTDKIKTQASINYEKVNALYDHRDFERVTSRINNAFEINSFISANIDVSVNQTNTNAPTINPIWDALRFAPIYAATWADGRIAQGQNGSNAYAALHYGGFDKGATTRLNGRASLQVKPFKDLTVTGVLAPYLYSSKGKKFQTKIPYYTANDPTVLAGYISGYSTTGLYENRGEGKSLTKQLIANYTRKLGNNNLNIMGGYEDFYIYNESLAAQAENYTLSSFPYLSLGPLDYMKNNGSAYETAYRSLFGRILYDYKDKYFLQANVRYDGSSRFHPSYRWGTFPSVSAGWALSEESFLKNSQVISFLKLRGSWGQLGNERIGNYPYQSSIGYSNALFHQGSAVISATTAAQSAYAIQNITWERTETADVGVDAYFLKNKLMFSADYYVKKTKDMLLELEIPDYMGFDNPQQNTGIMTTKGWDLQLAWKDRIGKLRYSVSLNLSDSRSNMGDLGGIVLDGAQIIRQGSEYNEWFGYVSSGLFQTAAEVTASPKLYASVKPGDVKYKDISGPNGVPDGKITPDYDRVLLGGSLPRYLYGGTVNLDYKGFDLSLAFQGVGKKRSRLVEQMVKPFFSAWTNAPAIIDGKYWSVYNTEKENQEAKYPRLSYQGSENNNYVMSDYWLINGAYFRLKNLVIGYTLPSQWLKSAKLNTLRVFASGTDLFSASHFPKGWDPEVNYASYISKSFNFGLSAKF